MMHDHDEDSHVYVPRDERPSRSQRRREALDVLKLAQQLSALSDAQLARREAAALHRVEIWRERLITDGDAPLDELMQQFPAADRQQLRQLARKARAERDAQKPLHAFHELFRALRELLG